MKSRIIWGAILLAAFAAFYYVTIRPTMNRPTQASIPADRSPLVRDRPTFNLPAGFDAATLPKVVMPTAPIVSTRVDPPALKPPEIPIQHGATIDFSIGAPVMRSGGEDDAALKKALKEMEEATRHIEFPGTKPYLDPNATPPTP
jgi:hypothetical protein